nr:unnamed protein product [Callosobruchus analis]
MLNCILLKNNHHFKGIDVIILPVHFPFIYFDLACTSLFSVQLCEPYQLTPVKFRTLYFAKKIIILKVLIYIIRPVHFLLHAYCL